MHFEIMQNLIGSTSVFISVLVTITSSVALAKSQEESTTTSSTTTLNPETTVIPSETSVVCENECFEVWCSEMSDVYGYNTGFLITSVIVLYLTYLSLITGIVNVIWRAKQKRELKLKYPKNKRKQRQMRMLVKFVDSTDNSDRSTTRSVNSGRPEPSPGEVGMSLKDKKKSPQTQENVSIQKTQAPTQINQASTPTNQPPVSTPINQPQASTPIKQASTPVAGSKFVDPTINP